MAYKYIIVRNSYLDGELNTISYGIAVAYQQEQHMIVLESFSDLSPDRERVKQLTELCNQTHLSAIHLHDVVDDFLVKL